MAKLAKGLELQITGFRIAPRDPNNPLVAAVGEDNLFQQPPMYEPKPRVLKEKPGMGGGFKVHEETLKTRQSRIESFNVDIQEEQQIADDSNIVTRDEIIKELNLTTGTQIGSEVKHGSLTKAAITKELVNSLSKELEKLRRQSENIQMRKTLLVEGKIDEETEDERREKIAKGLENEGCTVIHAEEERVQAMRHQTGQLGGLGAITMEEVLAMKEITAQRIKELETEYYK